MNDLYPGIAAYLAKILRLAPGTAQPFDPDADIERAYGLTSLDMMLFLTSACQTSGVPLNQLGEDDLVALTTLRKITQLLSEKLQQGSPQDAVGSPR